jgi:hypothetical protein
MFEDSVQDVNVTVDEVTPIPPPHHAVLDDKVQDVKVTVDKSMNSPPPTEFPAATM